MFPEIFCISPSMASKRDDLPQPTCPTIIVSWPMRVESTHKIRIYQIRLENYLILCIWCDFVPWGIRISILDNAGGPSGVQVKNPFVIYNNMERKDKQKPGFRGHLFSPTSETLFSSHWAQEQRYPLPSARNGFSSDRVCKGLYFDGQKPLNSNKHY